MCEFHKALHFVARERSERTKWMNMRCERNFTLVNIPEASNYSLIEQDYADLIFWSLKGAPCESLDTVTNRKIIRKNIGAEFGNSVTSL